MSIRALPRAAVQNAELASPEGQNPQGTIMNAGPQAMTSRPTSKSASRSDSASGEEASKARWDEVSVSTIVPKMRTEGLRAYFGQAEVLKGISLPIAEKQVTAVIGPSGCGKSTFV